MTDRTLIGQSCRIGHYRTEVGQKSDSSRSDTRARAPSYGGMSECPMSDFWDTSVGQDNPA